MQDVIKICTDLSIAYARHVDFGEYDKFVELFSEDAVLDLGFRLEGKAAIKASMDKRPNQLRSRHVMSNIYIEEVSEGEAKGISYLTLYRHMGADSLKEAPIASAIPAAVGHYTDHFVLTDDGWRIGYRRLEFAFQDPKFFGK